MCLNFLPFESFHDVEWERFVEQAEFSRVKTMTLISI